MRKSLVVAAAWFLGSNPAATWAQHPAPAMTAERLVQHLQRVGTDVQVDRNVVEFTYQGTRGACIYDVSHDRMRIVAPIIEDSLVSNAQRRVMMEANFDRALDARYATQGGVLYAVFIHPLSPLTEVELTQGIQQVAALQQNFGASYSSGALMFGAPAEPQ